MSTENESDTDDESEYGAVDEGFDEDSELFARDTGKSTSVGGDESSAETTAETTTPATEPDSATEESADSSGVDTQSASVKPGGSGDASASTATETTDNAPVIEESPDVDNEALKAVEQATVFDIPSVAPELAAEFPFLFSREGAQDARWQTWICFQPHVELADKEARRQAEDIFGDDMTDTDVREAIFIAGLRNFDEAVKTLHDWGFRPGTE